MTQLILSGWYSQATVIYCKLWYYCVFFVCTEVLVHTCCFAVFYDFMCRICACLLSKIELYIFAQSKPGLNSGSHGSVAGPCGTHVTINTCGNNQLQIKLILLISDQYVYEPHSRDQRAAKRGHR